MSSLQIPPVVPAPVVDCVELHRAFQGVGCDAAAVINILAHRAAEHRVQIQEVYGNMYQEDLIRRLKSELHFKLEKAMLLWMRYPIARDAYILRDAMNIRGSKRKSILLETIWLRSAKQLSSVAEVYSSKFQRSLLDDVRSATEGSFRKLVEAYLVAVHDESTNLGMHEAREEAENLFRAGEGRPSLDLTYFIQILTSRTREQLLSMFDSYKNIYGHEISKGLQKAHGKSEVQKEVTAVIKSISNPARYFAKVLRKSMQGLGTDDNTLIRVVITRSEIDMRDIKSEFIRKYNMSLDRTIFLDTSGNYRKFLLALIGSVADKEDSILKRLM